MPSKSKAQARFMAMCAHGTHARGKCPPAAVSAEFNAADKLSGILKGSKKYPAKKR